MGMKKNTGYSLIELMTMLAVVAIVMSFGVPMLKTYFQGNRMVTNTNDLIASISLARSEAIRRGIRTSICKSSNADSAAPVCDTTANWQDGWIVFVEDATGAARGAFGDYETGNGDLLVRVHPAAKGSNVTIKPQDNSIKDYVSFTSRGLPKLDDGGGQSGVFSICDERGLTNSAGNVIARGVELNVAGRVRSTADAAKIVSCP
jgi:type IV fimbrial biogenesis protein FimT